MFLNIDLEKIPKNLDLNHYLALIKIYMLSKKASFNYGASAYINKLIELNYINANKDVNNKLISVRLTNESTRLIEESFKLIEKFSENISEVDTELVTNLAKEMIELYPKGKKDNKWPFRSSVTTIVAKLKTFSVKNKVSLIKEFDNILKATQNYVEAFKNDKNGMSL